MSVEDFENILQQDYFLRKKIRIPILPVPDDFSLASWDTLHAKGGDVSYLAFLEDDKFTWTKNEETARSSQVEHFPDIKGIDYHNGFLYFVSEKS